MKINEYYLDSDLSDDWGCRDVEGDALDANFALKMLADSNTPGRGDPLALLAVVELTPSRIVLQCVYSDRWRPITLVYSTENIDEATLNGYLDHDDGEGEEDE